jgi:hypothetical protein
MKQQNEIKILILIAILSMIAVNQLSHVNGDKVEALNDYSV